MSNGGLNKLFLLNHKECENTRRGNGVDLGVCSSQFPLLVF